MDEEAGLTDVSVDQHKFHIASTFCMSTPDATPLQPLSDEFSLMGEADNKRPQRGSRTGTGNGAKSCSSEHLSRGLWRKL
jgi:hypothetical protein